LRTTAFTLALALGITTYIPSSLAALPTNTVNDGQSIQGGTYFNTADNATIFKNSAGTGLWLHTGNNLRGVEVDSTGKLTNNGGNFYFDAPGQVMRLDSNIDVRGIRDGSGAYLGNGGKVFVDAAYLFQNGNIYASGVNGGLVQFNVGGMTIANTSRIEATGIGGKGGAISFNASGTVDIGRQVVIDSSGKVTGTIDSNVINIEGGTVNMQGTLIAQGVESRGGTIRIVSTGLTDLVQSQKAIQNAVTSGVLTSTEASDINAQLTNLKTNSDGDIIIGANGNQSILQVTGANSDQGFSDGNDIADPTLRAGDGGTTILAAQRNVNNSGWLLNYGGTSSNAKGGNGGTISINAGNSITNTGRLVADGAGGNTGGDGGLIALSYKDSMPNSGMIRAIGGSSSTVTGNGGLVVFSSLNNPTGNGTVVTYPGFFGSSPGKLGSIVAPNPTTVSNTLIGVWRKTQPIELLTNAENVLILKNKTPELTAREQDAGMGKYTSSLTGYTLNATVRSIRDQQGQGQAVNGGQAESELFSKLLPGGAHQTDQTYFFRNLLLSKTTNDLLTFNPSNLKRFSGLNETTPFYTMTILSKDGAVDMPDMTFLGGGQGGGHFSVISSALTGEKTGAWFVGPGSFNIASPGLVDVSMALTSTGFDSQELHGGSLIAKSGTRISLGRSESTMLDGTSAGGSIQLISQGNLTNYGYIEANGQQIGGNFYIFSPNQIVNYGINQADGGQYGGDVRIRTDAPILYFNNTKFEATGTIQNGKVAVSPTN